MFKLEINIFIQEDAKVKLKTFIIVLFKINAVLTFY